MDGHGGGLLSGGALTRSDFEILQTVVSSTWYSARCPAYVDRTGDFERDQNDSAVV